ncbi:MAG: copper chaperone [Chloroflexi bacterium]|nr:MAG: copper chaperone [Chloroflexota bacterium]
MASETLKVPNISCEHCVKTIKRELEMLDSVASVTGDVETKLVTIEYTDGGNPEEVRKTLEEIGYPPE